MQNKKLETLIGNTYEDIRKSKAKEVPEYLRLLRAHINMKELIPEAFRAAYYKDTGRPRVNELESYIWYFVLRNQIGIGTDKSFLIVLGMSWELREFCGFKQMPSESDITRFRDAYYRHSELMFLGLVEVTEPICQEIDGKKSEYDIFDTSGIEGNVKENNPKYLNEKLEQAKQIAKNRPGYDPYKGVYGLLPETAAANPNVKQQYIDGHFCYAQKFGIISNGLGIVRHLVFFDEHFKAKYPEIVSKKTDNPDLDKEISDSKALRPVLTDFHEKHPDFGYSGTFIGDSAFDSYDVYPMLRDEFHFKRICIPINDRNSASAHADFDDNGTPVCPVDKTPFTFLGVCRGNNRSMRYKFVCHKSKPVKASSKRLCDCRTPCTNSSYGRCVYTYPHKELRLYPGLPRGTDHWRNLYRHRTLVERTINIFKNDFGLAHHRSFSSSSAKFELFFAGITQLVGVLLAHALHFDGLYKSVRSLISAVS